MFYQIWVKIREVGKWQSADYTIKVDADAVFVPQRLRTWLSSKPGDSPHGLYYENCPYVQYGFFGHLEILTTTSTRSRPSMWPPTAHAKRTDPRDRKIRSGIR